MIKPLLSAICFAVFLTAIGILVYRVKRGKDRCVREVYALKAISLLLSLAISAVECMSSNYSVWDVLALALGADIQEPAWLTLISRGLAAAILIACCCAVVRVYQKWDGPISRRQYQMDAQELVSSHMLPDLFVALAAIFRENYDLRPHEDLPKGPGFDGGVSAGELPWHVEFAKIYSLMSNQAHIDAKEDWHPLGRCFISSYGDLKIAVYCAASMPSDEEIDEFLAYIRQFQPKYFKVIAAVKNGERADFTASRGGQTVEYMFKCNALCELVDFSEYYRAVDAMYAKPLMENSNVCIEDIYVDPDCRLAAGRDDFLLSPYVERWLGEEGNRQLALLGDFGQGKTMFSLYLTHQMIHDQSDRIPILIPLRNKSPRNSSPVEILSYFAAQYGIPPEALTILNANGKLLLIFDGFDEMDLVGNDDIRKRHFRSLWKLVLPRSKVLITGRPNYFLNPDEMAGALGFCPDSSSAPYCEGLFLQPFDREKILLALRSAGKSVRGGIRRILDARMSASFLDLISRPSHLFLVSQIWETRQLETKYRNLTSAVIINEFLQDCFSRQAAKGVREPYFYLSSGEREYFMVGIAVWMYKAGAAAISYDMFQNVIGELLDMFPEKLGMKNPVFMNLRGGKSVREFVREDDHCFAAIVNDVRACGVLVNDVGNSGLCFAHKSFYDVLAAKFFLGKNMRFHNDAMTISQALEKSYAYNPRLKNDVVVRKLLAELISAEINLRMDGSGEKARCRKIFEQCRKTIAAWGVGRTPQALLRSCLQMSGDGRETVRRRVNPRRRHQNLTARLLVIYGITAAACLAFLVQGARLGRYQADAARYYAELSASVSEIPVPAAGWSINGLPVLMVFLLIGGAAAAACLAGGRLGLSLREKQELVLLTWYYACKENQISEQVILQQFSPEYTKAFTAYIQGRSLTEMQNQWERSRNQADRRMSRIN